MGDGGIEGIEDVVDDLLAVPPQDFTEARNAAAKQLRADGRREAADAVKGLPRPPLSLWALNRLAHEQSSLVETFLDAAGELREAYRSGGDIRAATAPQRDAEARVVAAAAELVRKHGANATETVMGRLRETLRAAAADAAVASDLREGRLLREPEAPSIDALLESMPRAPAAPRSKAAGRDGLREEMAEAQGAASRAREAARAAADAERSARGDWENAQKIAERAQRRADAAADHLADLQHRLTEL
jgi:hypothetical protein